MSRGWALDPGRRRCWAPPTVPASRLRAQQSAVGVGRWAERAAETGSLPLPPGAPASHTGSQIEVLNLRPNERVHNTPAGSRQAASHPEVNT